MAYCREIGVETEGSRGILYLTDGAQTAERLRTAGEAVLIHLHEGNRGEDFSSFLFAMEDPEELEPAYAERVYRRLKGLPWNIASTARCLIRETVPGDVEAFWRIYSHPAITAYTEGLYPDIEEEREYVRRYIRQVYTFFGFGIWTVVERVSGAVIGRAGLNYREGFGEPELGFVIGVPWQGRGYGEEACRAVLSYGWEELGFQRVQALVEPGNLPSLRLCGKLGFWTDRRVVLGKREYCRLLLENPGDIDESDVATKKGVSLSFAL